MSPSNLAELPVTIDGLVAEKLSKRCDVQVLSSSRAEAGRKSKHKPHPPNSQSREFFGPESEATIYPRVGTEYVSLW